jgi:arginase
MTRFSVIDAPSVLGLRPSGVQNLPRALKNARLVEKLHAESAGQVAPLPYQPERDRETLLLNPEAIKKFSLQLADAVGSVLHDNRFPVVLGGDCSILIGNLLALRRLGRYGLFFLDGHADFYQPEASPTGEAADMDLAIVSGRGPDVLANVGRLGPLARDEDIVVFGYRDAEEAARYGSQNVKDTGMRVFDLARVRSLGVKEAAKLAVKQLTENQIDGFWIHFDVDVLNDRVMPAVDYRLEGGLAFEELRDVLQILKASRRAVGIDITIFNPELDADGSIARQLVDAVAAGLAEKV